MANKNNNINLSNINDPELLELLKNNNTQNLNNLVKPNTNNTNNTNEVLGTEKSFTGTATEILSNYFMVVSVVIALILTLIIYFLSKSYRVGRTTDTMVLYQNYQTLTSFPFSKAGNIRLGDCRIASAYNCALSGYQMLDYTSEEIILAVLRSGARYIEFNVFNSEYGDKAIPVVSNGYKQGEWKMTLNDTPLEACFYTIATNAFKVMDSHTGVPNPDDPLFIGFNLNTNSNLSCLNKLGKMITDYFGDRLMDSKYSFQSSDKIPEIPVKKISGRVVFFCSDGFQGSKMEEVVNYSWDNIEKNPKHTLQRIYYKDVLEGKITFEDLRQYNEYGMTIIVPHTEGDFWTNNYNPEPFLDVGCQFVAMNYQYIDSNIDPYITLFKNYSLVLKPVELRKMKSGSATSRGLQRESRTDNTTGTGIKVAQGTSSSSENAEVLITRPMTTIPITNPTNTNTNTTPTNLESVNFRTTTTTRPSTTTTSIPTTTTTTTTTTRANPTTTNPTITTKKL
mgnify:FL=1